MTYTEVGFSGIEENNAYTEVGFSPKSGFTKIVLTSKFPLPFADKRHIKYYIIIPLRNMLFTY